MKRTRLLGVLAVAFLLVLAGCSGGVTDTTTSPNTTTTETPAPTDDSATPTKPSPSSTDHSPIASGSESTHQTRPERILSVHFIIDGNQPPTSKASTLLSYDSRERCNPNFIAFLVEAATRFVTPYYAPENAYKSHILYSRYSDVVEEVYEEIIEWIPGVYLENFPDYSDLSSRNGIGPLTQFGYTDDGQQIDDSEIDRIMPSLPLWPFD